MKVSRFMTRKLVTVTPDTPVRDAFLTMRSHRVRHLPVLEEDRLVGIISDRDLRRPRWTEKLDDWTSYYRIADHTVADVMTRNPEVIRTYEGVGNAVKMLEKGRYGALPVVDKRGDLVGILSAHDLLAALSELLDREYAAK